MPYETLSLQLVQKIGPVSVAIAPEFLEDARAAVLPGATLIVTDVRVGGQTRSGPDVNILTTD
jgi:hypothetical protein